MRLIMVYLGLYVRVTSLFDVVSQNHLNRDFKKHRAYHCTLGIVPSSDKREIEGASIKVFRRILGSTWGYV